MSEVIVLSDGDASPLAKIPKRPDSLKPKPEYNKDKRCHAAPVHEAALNEKADCSVVELGDSGEEENGSGDRTGRKHPNCRRSLNSEFKASKVADKRREKEDKRSSKRTAPVAKSAPSGKRARLTSTPLSSRSAAPEPEPCGQALEEICALLSPLLTGDEVRILAKVRRRYTAVLSLSEDQSARRQHLLGASRQCAERLRAEPGRCFTTIRCFLEQVDQLKLVASSARSRKAATAADVKPSTSARKPGSSTSPGKAGSSTSVATSSAKTAEKTAAREAAGPSVSSVAGPAAEDDAEKQARRHRRHLAKLEKTLRRLEREIERYEAREVDWDDGAGSAYMVGARLKKRYVQVYQYYCRLVGQEDEAERLGARRIRFEGTRYPELNRRIEKFVNRTREFPDFKDVLELMQKANERDRLGLRPGALKDEAQKAFECLGEQLQRRRRAALAESMDALCGAEEWRSRDPASQDALLGGRLDENAQRGGARLNDVFSDFVRRQEEEAAERKRRRAAEGAEGEGESAEEPEEEEDEEAEESEVTDDEADPPLPLAASTPGGGVARDSDGESEPLSPLRDGEDSILESATDLDSAAKENDETEGAVTAAGWQGDGRASSGRDATAVDGGAEQPAGNRMNETELVTGRYVNGTGAGKAESGAETESELEENPVKVEDGADLNGSGPDLNGSGGVDWGDAHDGDAGSVTQCSEEGAGQENVKVARMQSEGFSSQESVKVICEKGVKNVKNASTTACADVRKESEDDICVVLD